MPRGFMYFFMPGPRALLPKSASERYSNADQLKAMQATVPMNRLCAADECAGTFVYLASDEMSGYVTGQVIEVNGGQYMP